MNLNTARQALELLRQHDPDPDKLAQAIKDLKLRAESHASDPARNDPCTTSPFSPTRRPAR